MIDLHNFYSPIRTLKKPNSQQSLYNKSDKSSTQSLIIGYKQSNQRIKQKKLPLLIKFPIQDIKKEITLNNQQKKLDVVQQQQILNVKFEQNEKIQQKIFTINKLQLAEKSTPHKTQLKNNNPNIIFLADSFHKEESQLQKQYDQSLRKFDKIIRQIQTYPISIDIVLDFKSIEFEIRKYLQSLISFHNISKIAIDSNLQQSLMKKYLFSYAYISKEIDHNKIIIQENVAVKKFKNCVYFGNLKNLKKEGFGVLIYFDGRVFQGLFKNDVKIQGLEVKDKQIYLGKYFQGLREDNQGLLISSNNVYYGKFKKGYWQKTGMKLTNDYICFDYSKTINLCFQKTINNQIYLGNLQNDMKNGFGIQKFANGDFYIGHYRQSRSQGYGQYYWKNGASYKGNFFFGMRHGKGKFVLKQGDSYEGQYMNDKKCGEGTYTWSNGIIYKGQFQNDFRHGYGEMLYPNGIKEKGYWISGIQRTQHNEFKRKSHKLSFQKQQQSSFRESRLRKSVCSKQLQIRSKNTTLNNQSDYYRYQQETIYNRNKYNRGWNPNIETIKKKNVIPKFNLM